MTSLGTVIARGVAASRPAAASLPVGSLYFSTDTLVLERTNGSSWDTMSVGGTLSISGLTQDTTPDRAADFVPTYDTSATANKKVALKDVGYLVPLYDSGELGAAAATIDSGTFPASDAKDLLISFYGAQDGTGSGNNFELRGRVNNDSGSNYDRQSNAGRNTGTQNAAEMGATSWLLGSLSANGHAGGAEIVIPGYQGTTLRKAFMAQSHYQQGTTTNDVIAGLHTGGWRSTAAITRFGILLGGTGKFAIGSRLTIWGRRAS